MKSKTKTLLLISVLGVGAAAASGVSTFAWFQVNRSVTLAYSSITMENRAAELSGKLIKLDEGTLSDNDTKLTGATSTASDVSSKDGSTFYSPDWGMEIGNGKAPVRVNDVTEDGYNVYYAEYAFSLTHSGKKSTDAGYNAKVDRDFNVFFTNDTKITPHTTGTTLDEQAAKDLAVANWTRVAILKSSDAISDHDSVKNATLTPILTFEAKATDTISYNDGTEDKTADCSADKTQFVKSATLDEDTGLMDFGSYETDDRHYVEGDNGIFEDTNKNSSSTSGNYLDTLASGTTQYYVVRVWLEGSENDNQKLASGGMVDVNLEINAVNAPIA